ncbi:MAG: hypothetical protein V3G42_14485 [Oscillospiraceae bacterium]
MDKKKQEARQKVWEHLHKDGITFNDVLDCYVAEKRKQLIISLTVGLRNYIQVKDKG